VLRLMRRWGEVVAEDLGSVPPFLRPALERSGVPGYRVLRWEKEGDAFRDPATWPNLSVATTPPTTPTPPPTGTTASQPPSARRCCGSRA
jgi:4-alpha-glucanotransferase